MELMPMIPIATIILGGIAGGFLTPLLTLVYHFIFFRSSQSDGQYTIVLLVAAMQGAALGGVAGLVFGIWTTGKRRLASQVAKCGGWSLTALFCFLGWQLASGTENPDMVARVISTLFWSLIPMIGSVALTFFSPGGG
jgi:hypothetical protein